MNWIAKQEETFDRNRFGAMTILLTSQSALGGVTAALSIQNNLWFLVSLGATVSMASLAFFIAQTNAKSCLIMFYISMIVNTVLLFVNLAM
jgi:hypothetical protein